MNTRIRTAGTGLVAALALALAGCATLGSGGTEGSDAPQEISTAVPEEDVTLRLAFTDDPPTDALIEGFQEKHPNVTIEAEQTDFGNYVTSITRSMTSEDAPDIAQYNPGAMRSLVPAGHVMDLSDYSELYGWEEAFPPASLDQLRSDDEAKQFGTGGLYAAPGALSVVGVFYNKGILDDAGVDSLPGTLDDFTQALAAVESNDEDPLSVGGLEVGGFHLWNTVLNSVGDTQSYLDWVYGAPDSTIETDSARQATDIVAQWAEAGYITDSANATSDADALASFTAGDAAFHITGNWAAAAVQEEMGDDAGFFILPGTSADAQPVASGSSVAYSISSQSEHPDVAAAFLDYLRSPEAAVIQVDSGFMPVSSDAEIATDGLLGEIATEFTPVAEHSNIVPFPDFAAPGMVDRLTAGQQGIISDEMTTEEYLAMLQEAWVAHHG